jgi:hypothetical protein
MRAVKEKGRGERLWPRRDTGHEEMGKYGGIDDCAGRGATGHRATDNNIFNTTTRTVI